MKKNNDKKSITAKPIRINTLFQTEKFLSFYLKTVHFVEKEAQKEVF